MTTLNQEDLIEQAGAASAPEPQPDPLQDELNRVQGRTSQFTPEEKATFNFKKKAEELTSMGIDPATVLGTTPAPQAAAGDDAPVTIGMLKKIQQEEAAKSALQLADGITNQTERDLVKWHLQNTIKTTGNPQQDLENAMSLVNAVKNKQIIEEIARKGTTKTYSTSGGAAPAVDPEVELTPIEQQFMDQFGLTKEQVIKTRTQ